MKLAQHHLTNTMAWSPLVFPQAAKRLPAFYQTQRFTTMLTTACQFVHILSHIVFH